MQNPGNCGWLASGADPDPRFPCFFRFAFFLAFFLVCVRFSFFSKDLNPCFFSWDPSFFCPPPKKKAGIIRIGGRRVREVIWHESFDRAGVAFAGVQLNRYCTHPAWHSIQHACVACLMLCTDSPIVFYAGSAEGSAVHHEETSEGSTGGRYDCTGGQCSQHRYSRTENQVGMNGDTFSIKAPKECSKKFAATLKGKFLTRENVLRLSVLFLEDFGAPL